MPSPRRAHYCQRSGGTRQLAARSIIGHTCRRIASAVPPLGRRSVPPNGMQTDSPLPTRPTADPHAPLPPNLHTNQDGNSSGRSTSCPARVACRVRRLPAAGLRRVPSVGRAAMWTPIGDRWLVGLFRKRMRPAPPRARSPPRSPCQLPRQRLRTPRGHAFLGWRACSVTAASLPNPLPASERGR